MRINQMMVRTLVGTPPYSDVLERASPSSINCDVVNLVLSSRIRRSPSTFVAWLMGKDSTSYYDIIAGAEISKDLTILIHAA